MSVPSVCLVCSTRTTCCRNKYIDAKADWGYLGAPPQGGTAEGPACTAPASASRRSKNAPPPSDPFDGPDQH